MGVKVLDLKQLETFMTVVEWGSFSDAAKHLYLSQPTVSVHIKQLEEEFGTELIKRTTKSIEITKDGREFYNYAKSISDIINNAKDTFSNKGSSNLTITASSIPASYLLPEVIKAYHDVVPEVLITVDQTDSIDATDRVLKGRSNVGIVGSVSMNSDLKYEKLCEDKLVIVAPYNDYFLDMKESGASLEEVLQEPIISREQGSGTLKEALKMLSALDIDPANFKTIAVVNSNEALINYVKAGLGISIISEIAVLDDVRKDNLITFDIDAIESYRYFYLITRKNSVLSQQMNHFINFFTSYIKQNKALYSV